MARITAMSVRLAPEVREQVGLAAERADTAPSTLAAELIATGSAVLGRQVGDRRLCGGWPPSAVWRRRVL